MKLLQSPEVFDDEAVIDEVIDFFFAGSMTTQFATQMLIAHFATDPQSLSKARAEIHAEVSSDQCG